MTEVVKQVRLRLLQASSLPYVCLASCVCMCVSVSWHLTFGSPCPQAACVSNSLDDRSADAFSGLGNLQAFAAAFEGEGKEEGCFPSLVLIMFNALWVWSFGMLDMRLRAALPAVNICSRQVGLCAVHGVKCHTAQTSQCELSFAGRLWSTQHAPQSRVLL